MYAGIVFAYFNKKFPHTKSDLSYKNEVCQQGLVGVVCPFLSDVTQATYQRQLLAFPRHQEFLLCL